MKHASSVYIRTCILPALHNVMKNYSTDQTQVKHTVHTWYMCMCRPIIWCQVTVSQNMCACMHHMRTVAISQGVTVFTKSCMPTCIILCFAQGIYSTTVSAHVKFSILCIHNIIAAIVIINCDQIFENKSQCHV